jgi:4-amino-4-deoxy-L-arabinose transferase-like glycosyltransferase
VYPDELSSRLQFWCLAIASLLLLVGPVRLGDLAGYDDAVYAHISKTIVQSGDWINIQSNGFPALEHPPGFVWMQAALFSVFGFSDFLAKLPSALCGVGTVLLVFWLAKRLLNDERAALVAMLVMLATPYFIKYTSHGMTDIPFTFLFTAVICAWVGELYVVVAILAAYALLTRGVVGFAVPLTLAIDLLLRPRGWKAWAAIVVSLLPIAAWYGYQLNTYGEFFWQVQLKFLNDKVAGEVEGLRRFTGAFEYAWMLLGSYWPWLPFLIAGLWIRDKRLRLLYVWCAVMFVACSVGGSRVLRYLLPAYPAFSIFAAVGLMRWVPERFLRTGMSVLAPLAVVVAAGVALFPPVSLHADEIKPIAAAVKSVTQEKERFAFYDAGQSRFDETGQIQWYGDRVMWILTDAQAFENALAEPISQVWVVDAATFDKYLAARATVVARRGHLVCVRLSAP